VGLGLLVNIYPKTRKNKDNDIYSLDSFII